MTQSLQDFLGSGDALGRLRDHSRRLRALQAQLERLLPHGLAQNCPVGNLKGDTLLLLALNGGAAARVRQLLPTLQRQLAEAGTLVSKIEVKVRPVVAKPEPAAKPPRELGQSAVASLRELEASLPADSELREALTQLIARARIGTR